MLNKKIKSILAMLLVLCLTMGLVACGSSGAKDNVTDSGATNSGQTSETKDNNDGGSETAEFALLVKTFANESQQNLKRGMEEAAEKLGVKVDMYATNTEDDVEGQVALLENLITKGYKGIVISPITPDNLNSAIADATAKGIYIVNVDEQINIEGLRALGGSVYAFVASDNVKVGKTGGQYLVEQMGGSGQVVIIEGKAGAVSGEDRRDGAALAFEEAPGIELVAVQPADWDRTKAYDVATNLLSKYPDLKGIYCCNDVMAMGALEAVKNANRDVLVVGTDGNSDAVDSVKAGELTATVAQDSAGMGARAVEVLVRAVNENKPIDINADPTFEAVDAYLVTKD